MLKAWVSKLYNKVGLKLFVNVHPVLTLWLESLNNFSRSGDNWPQIADGASEVTQAVETLLAEVRANAPWQKHCETTLSLLEQMFANFINENRERRANDGGKPSGQNYQMLK